MNKFSEHEIGFISFTCEKLFTVSLYELNKLFKVI